MGKETRRGENGMRVLQINSVCQSGSTGKIAYDLHTMLRAQGHTSAVCYGRGRAVNDAHTYKFSGYMGVYSHVLLTRLTGLHGYYSNYATAKLLSFMDEFQPEVVHLHNLHGYYLNMFRVVDYLKAHRIKTIWTLHDEFMYTGRCGYSYECEKWKMECEKCPHLSEYPSSLWFDFSRKMFRDKKRLFDEFDNLIIATPSQWLAGRVKQSFLKEKEIVVIQNGIDTENVFYPRKFDQLKVKHHFSYEKIVLAVAPDIMSQRKGGRYLLELAKMMRNEKIKFVLVGVTNLNQKFDDNVIAVARTEDQQELAEYYSMADVFVICSSKENFPTTCIEAISCGTPICGFDEGGTRETAPGRLGTFVKYGDMDALRDAVFATLQSTGLSNMCAKHGQSAYSKQKMYSSYLSLYQ